MKLSKQTLVVLDNFSSINGGLIIKPGNTIKTMAATREILATAVVEDEFPQKLCIYDMNLFLKTHGLFRDPEILFPNEDNVDMFDRQGNPKCVVIKCAETDSNVTFYMSKESFITKAPDSVNFPPFEVSIAITADQLNDLLQASRVLNLPNLAIRSDGSEVTITAFDKDNNETANTFSLVLCPGNGIVYDFHFMAKNLSLIPGDYAVEISSAKMSKFTNAEKQLEYIIAVEKTSTFGG